ncbi:trimeric intracellular cation channel family protein [Pararhizobium arenae]|uniref:trimeric intracellular cation channel family protein n=1 Tax=Pararhizobium arenae TaxID=1856850 RepID=UPI00094AF044|nr:trimeric intracellular cation channel family protein [Pararhizobium arenae]
MSILEFLDYAGVAVFAATGALAASRKHLDVIGYIFFASVTGIGGGTLRDLVLGATPVFWIENPLYLLVCTGSAMVVYLSARRMESRYRFLVWLDAVGLSAYCVMGAAKGLAATGSATVALVTGVLTATCGGILRDLLAGEPSVLMRPEIYVTAALIGAGVFTGLTLFEVPMIFASALGVISAFCVRGGALKYGWTLPVGDPRPPRHPDDVL